MELWIKFLQIPGRMQNIIHFYLVLGHFNSLCFIKGSIYNFRSCQAIYCTVHRYQWDQPPEISTQPRVEACNMAWRRLMLLLRLYFYCIELYKLFYKYELNDQIWGHPWWFSYSGDNPLQLKWSPSSSPFVIAIHWLVHCLYNQTTNSQLIQWMFLWDGMEIMPRP